MKPASLMDDYWGKSVLEFAWEQEAAMNGLPSGPWEPKQRPMRAAALEITGAMFFELLKLPETSAVRDVFVDPWTKNLVLIIEDQQFPTKEEGARFISVSPVYEQVEGRTFQFVEYYGLSDARDG